MSRWAERMRFFANIRRRTCSLTEPIETADLIPLMYIMPRIIIQEAACHFLMCYVSLELVRLASTTAWLPGSQVRST